MLKLEDMLAAVARSRRKLSVPARVPRIAGAAACLAAALVAGYFMWLRDSSLVRVERTTVEGLSGKQAPRIRKALTEAARDMTTLHVRREELARAVSAYPVVRSVEATPDFPHGLRLTVVEQTPVAVLARGGRDEVGVAADGTLLHGLAVKRRLPELPLDAVAPGQRLRDPEALRALEAAAAAPPPLASEVRRIVERRTGLVARLRDGSEVLLGDLARLPAKWAAAAAALADPLTAGAEYVDVRLPERPASG